MRIFLLLLFISPSVFAAYTEMVIEGVKQSNGVWTTAGVMDTQGFVRTTGAVTVAGATRNLPVAMAADVPLATTMLKGASRAAGPILLAATAYDVYQWFTSEDIGEKDGQWSTITSQETDYSKVGDCFQITSSSYNYGTGVLSSYTGRYITQGQPYSTVESCMSFTGSNQLLYFPNQANYLIGTTSPLGEPRKSPKGLLIIKADAKTHNPFDESSLNKLPAPSNGVLNSGFSKLPSLSSGFPIKSTSFIPFSEWMSDPYFKDGNWWRDRMDVSPAPTPEQPTRVRVDYGPVKLEGLTDPTVKPDDTPASENTQPKEQTKFCDDNPQSIACVELGQLEDEQTTLDERPFHITPESPWGQGSASCPTPETETLRTGATVTFSYQPTCDFFSSIRPAVIAVAFLAALYIALGIPAGKGN